MARIPRVLLDFRMQHAGVGRYGKSLIDGFAKVEDAPELVVVGRGSGLIGRLATQPFTPWGRSMVGRRATDDSVDLIHGLHLEVPRSKTPSVVTIPDLIPLEFPGSMPNPLRRALYRNIVTTSIRRAAKVITHSEMTVPSLEAVCADPSKIVVIPHGVDPLFRPLDNREKEEARKRFAGGRPYVAASIRDKAHKNIEGLDSAAGLLAGKIEVLCSGWAPAKHPPNLRFVGELTEQELAGFYGGAEVFVLPSLTEGFGLPAIEALACGVPVVCGSGIGAVPYVTGEILVVDVADPSKIVGGVERLLGEANDTLVRSQKRIEAARSLTIEREASLTVEVYRGVWASS